MAGTTVFSILLCLGLAACGGDGGPGRPSGSPSAVQSGGPTRSGGTAQPGDASGRPGEPAAPDGSSGTIVGDGRTGAPSTWGTGAVRTERPSALPAQLVSLRSARNTVDGASFDRLVLEFRGGVPGYTAGYVDEVIRPGSGAPLPLKGAVRFEVVVTPAAMHDDAGDSTLTTPPAGGGLPALTSYAVAGDFEGYVHLGIGLENRVGFRVVELRNPDRLVIDFAG
ncbi:AMIN-like domain-containing (lipo)protein [Parafrankia sp. FMc2]|uniref:AMIN-like domain-containing (lipo)protein n=1 Tax=Parafrankia sp. FMc2 TaxID=3233196 RepID=UPI0034D4D3E4